VTVADAIDAIRGLSEVEMVFYLYVTGPERMLRGVTSLRQLLLAMPDATLGAIMNTRVICVHTDTKQEAHRHGAGRIHATSATRQ